MKAKQDHIKAVFTTEEDHAVQVDNKKIVTVFRIVDKTTEKTVVDCRTYVGKSKYANTVLCNLWVRFTDSKKPDSFEYNSISGKGMASGYGYCVTSTAIQDAVSSAGIKLYGTAYPSQNGRDIDFKKQTNFAGTGLACAEKALLAIAYAAGYNNVICVQING